MVKVVYGLVFSTVAGFFAGFIVTKIIEAIAKNADRRRTQGFFKGGQIAGAASMAFMHGAQDGQKFMGVFMLGVFLSNGVANVDTFVVPIWLMILCSLVMGLGTSIGGYKIIKSVGMDMAKLQRHQGFAADIAASICLFISSYTGIPVSTTHMKTTAIMGVGASRRISAVNWLTVKDMVLAWVLTFPGCGLIGYLMSVIFMKIF
jgi:PiT family inorganic phosphate transporter